VRCGEEELVVGEDLGDDNDEEEEEEPRIIIEEGRRGCRALPRVK